MLPEFDAGKTRARSRWRRAFSLRGLMGLVLVIGGGLGWGVEQIRVHRDALATITAGGGRVTFRDTDARQNGWWIALYRRTGWGYAREVWGISLNDRSIPPVPVNPAVSRDEVFAALGRLGSVGYLTVTGGRVSAASLTLLAPLQLDYLMLAGVDEVSGAELAVIAQLQSLSRLNIDRPKVKLTRTAVAAAASLPRLEQLRLDGLERLEATDLAPLRRLDQLRSLRIFPAPTDEATIDQLRALPALTSLDLVHTQPTDAALRRLVTAIPHLEFLAIDAARLTDAGVETLAILPGLKGLDLSGRWRAESVASGHLTDASLLALGRCRKLTALIFNGGHFTDAGLDALPGLPFRTLVLGSIDSVSPSTLARLVTGPTWSLLGLHGPGINDAALPTLAAVVKPRTCLSLQNAAITDAGMAQLATFPVRALYLTGTTLSDAGLATLAAATNTATEVVAWDTRVTAAGAAAFRASRPGTDLVFGPEPADD